MQPTHIMLHSHPEKRRAAQEVGLAHSSVGLANPAHLCLVDIHLLRHFLHTTSGVANLAAALHRMHLTRVEDLSTPSLLPSLPARHSGTSVVQLQAHSLALLRLLGAHLLLARLDDLH